MNNTRTKDLTIIALMAAVTVIMAQIAIPMPAGVPMTLQTLAVTLAGVILGAKRGAISMLIYLLLGAVGLPVFSGFRGGLAMLVGPTGGFLISFPIMAFIIGLGAASYRAGSNGVAASATNTANVSGAAKASSRSSLFAEEKNNPLFAVRFWGFLILGTVINYIIGTAMFCFSTGASLSSGLAACVIPFIPTTIIKALIGGILGLRIRKAIN